ncbi:hypothetical protein TVAGG3_0799380, partial [Trichomonas vaginalis G3]
NMNNRAQRAQSHIVARILVGLFKTLKTCILKLLIYLEELMIQFQNIL